jgi:enoyl-CoA hydratase/carnithine racemase
MMDTDTVLVDANANGITVITLNRPQRLNAVTGAMLDRLALKSRRTSTPTIRCASLCSRARGVAFVRGATAMSWGMSREMPLEHWFRALRLNRVVEGRSEIHQMLIARDLLGDAALDRPAK